MTAAALPLAHRPEIDSLRALAMTAVVAMHCRLLPMGWTGVWLFFVISGYVVTLSILRHHDEQIPGSGLRRFFTQRAARILPAYYGYLLLGLALCLISGQTLAPVPWLSLALFGHNVAMDMGAGEVSGWHVGHLWTLSVEMQFYLVYGLAAHYLPARQLRWLLYGFVVLAPVARAVAGYALQHTDPLSAAYIVYSAPGLHFDSFALGCLLALAGREGITRKRLWQVNAIAIVALACYVVTYSGINLLIRHDHGLDVFRNIISGILIGQGREVVLYSVLAIVFVAVLQQTLIRAAWLRPLIASRIAQWIGRISYGGYIYHPLCIALASWLLYGQALQNLSGLRRFMIFCLAYLLTLAVSWASLRWLEQPVGRVIAHRLGKAPHPASSMKRFALNLLPKPPTKSQS